MGVQHRAGVPGEAGLDKRRAVHLHGSLGTTDELPLAGMWMSVPALALVDGPTEVHQVTVARQLLRRYSPVGGLFPGEHIPPKLAAAREKYAPVLREFAQ